MNKYRNHYTCPCGHNWQDDSKYMNNDRCPACDKEIEPMESQDLTVIEKKLFAEELKQVIGQKGLLTENEAESIRDSIVEFLEKKAQSIEGLFDPDEEEDSLQVLAMPWVIVDSI